MPDREPFTDTRRAQEEEFFHKRDRELLEAMRRRDQAEAELRRLSEATGISDRDILRDLQQLQCPPTAALLHLVPLVRVAWSDGSVTGRERERIFEAARSQGIEAPDRLWRELAGWLDRRPTEEFFRWTFRAIRALLEAMPWQERVGRKRDTVADCTRVAEASGGFLGLGPKVCEAERRVIDRIAHELEYESRRIG